MNHKRANDKVMTNTPQNANLLFVMTVLVHSNFQVFSTRPTDIVTTCDSLKLRKPHVGKLPTMLQAAQAKTRADGGHVPCHESLSMKLEQFKHALKFLWFRSQIRNVAVCIL